MIKLLIIIFKNEEKKGWEKNVPTVHQELCAFDSMILILAKNPDFTKMRSSQKALWTNFDINELLHILLVAIYRQYVHVFNQVISMYHLRSS